jgi:hypothetical protein
MSMLPQVRLQPWYPGQPGVWGSDVQRGLRWEPTGIVLYVDENHPGTHSVGDGTNPEEPLDSIQTAINNLIAFATALNCTLEGSVIVVANEATIAETVTIPATAPTHCTILGAGSTAHQPVWTAATAAGIALTVQREGWTIEGFTFETGTAGTAIRLDELPASSYSAYKTTIRNCRFDGLWGGLYGVAFHGAPHRILIEGCEFLEYHRGDSSAYAICVTDSAHTLPYECHILNNMFWENDNHVGSLGPGNQGWNMSRFQGNTFHEGTLNPTTIKLDMRAIGGLGNNIITGNVFGGTYSQAGGYYPHAGTPDNWVGNIAEDVASPQVADNGLTIAVPV